MTRLPADRLADLAGVWSPAHRGAFCPVCGVLVPTCSTRAWEHGQRLRWHRCPCGERFKSVQSDPIATALEDEVKS